MIVEVNSERETSFAIKKDRGVIVLDKAKILNRKETKRN